MRQPVHHQNEWEELSKTIRPEKLDWDHVLEKLKTSAYHQLIDSWITRDAYSVGLQTDLYGEATNQAPFFGLLQQKTSRLIGIDIAFATVKQAKDKTKLRSGDAMLVADVRKLPFKPESIDLVFSPSTLDHFDNIYPFIKSLNNIHSCLKIPGLFLLVLDNPHNIGYPFLRLAVMMNMTPFYIGRTYSRHRLKRILAAWGWHIQTFKGFLHHPRTLGVLLAKIASWINHPGFTQHMRNFLDWWQQFDSSRWQFLTGCFLAVEIRKTKKDTKSKNR